MHSNRKIRTAAGAIPPFPFVGADERSGAPFLLGAVCHCPGADRERRSEDGATKGQHRRPGRHDVHAVQPRYQSRTRRDYFAWAQGFMSAIVLSRPPGVDEDLDLNPASFGLVDQVHYLEEHCARNLSADFSDAVEALYKRLRRESGTRARTLNSEIDP